MESLRSIVNSSDSKSTLKVVGSVALGVYAIRWVLNRRPRNKKKRYVGSPHATEPARSVLDEVFIQLSASFAANRTSKIKDTGRWDYEYRLQQLYGLRDMFHENREALWAAAKSDIGRTKSEMVLDCGASLAELEALIKGLKEWMKPEKRGTPLWMMPASSYIIREPLGVCLVLGAWNYALATSVLPMAGAICAGNAVVLKPSEVCPAQSALLAKLLPKYVDPKMVQVIQGGPSIAASLVDSYDWGKVFYTGGGKIGAQIGVSCAGRHIPVCLELGGKSPTVILEDANLTVSCRRIVQGKFVNSGQTCIAPDFILVVGDEKRHKQVTDALKAEIAKQFPGDVSAYPEFARIVNGRHFERVKALMSHGKVIYGGKTDASQNFIEPTLFTDCNPESPIMQEEIFGPLLPIVYIRTVEDAINYFTDRPKALCLYIFGSSRRMIDHLLSHTTSGTACINEAVFQYLNPSLPFGGVGPSGVGGYHGEASFKEFSHSKSVLSRVAFGDVYIRYLPYLGENWVQNVFGVLLTL